MLGDMDLLLRCRSFALRTQGDVSTQARARFYNQLNKKGLSGPVDETLAAALAERREDAVYVCVGSSCSKTPLERPGAGLPVRETACLGACQHSPAAHRTTAGAGQTHAALDDALLHSLVQGQDSAPLRRRRWSAGTPFPSPSLAPLDALLGAWSGPGGFSERGGCRRTLSVDVALGGRFLDLCFANEWPTITGRVNRYQERLTLQADGEKLSGVLLDHRGGNQSVSARARDGALEVWTDAAPERRRVLSLTAGGLSERHERRLEDGWRLGFRAALSRS